MSEHFASVPLAGRTCRRRVGPCLQKGDKDSASNQKTHCAVGSTVAASMGIKAGRHSTRSAENLVLTVTKRSCLGLGASASIVQLVESLVWPFVCRRSCNEIWFEDKELNRFVTSMRHCAQMLIKYTSVDNQEQKFLKFWLDTLLCQVFHDDQRPPRPDWLRDPLFKGWCKRGVIRSVARRDVSFIYSLQKGSKRGWPAMSHDSMMKALKLHAERLSEVRPSISEELAEIINLDSSQVFVGGDPVKFMPSGSACSQASRQKGGALSLFKRYRYPWSDPDSAKIGRLPVLNASLNVWRNSTYHWAEQNAWDRLVAKPDGSVPALDVDVVAIPEPGKFRIITKGDGYLYTALQPLQGVMLECWKRHPASTMLHDDLTEAVRKLDRVASNFKFLCSVDYEAATDLIKRDATLAAYNQIWAVRSGWSGMTDDMPGATLGGLSLFGSRARYPGGNVINVEEGQLMGHPLSFPLLCVINLAVYHLSLERWIHADFDNRDHLRSALWNNVLVNGDDMLFKCDEEFYDIFKVVSADAGFHLSAGKNYLSPDCCMINSQVFKRSGGVMKRHGYLNLKLVKGTCLKSGDSEATPTQIGKDLSSMFSLCPWTSSAIAYSFKRWSADWFGPRYKPNWYLPVHLGGFGVDVRWAPSTWRVTRSQRIMAARFVSDPRMALYRRKGISIPTAKLAGAIANWRVVVGDYVPEKAESDSEDWLGRLAYAGRAHSGSQMVSDAVFVAKFLPEFRLRPMSIEGLLLYWVAQVFATAPPPCPPIGLIKIRDNWQVTLP